jgi:hypothetical protein
MNSAVPIPVSGPAGLLPIAKQKTYTSRDGNVAEKIRLDVTGFTLNSIRELLVSIAVEEMQNQIRMDNPPAFAEVDGTRGKGIAHAQRRLTISFGTRLKVAALAALKAGLMAAISKSTEARSGRLSSPANWEYRYVRSGRVEPLPMGGASGIPMGPNDVIFLMPAGVVNNKGEAYATAVNMRVAGGGKLSFRRSANGRVARKNQSIGFLALAARSAKASAAFAGFNVIAGFTSKHAVRGEVVKIGGVRTGYIKISPKLGRK